MIVRSSANIQSGARSKLSAIMHGALLLVSLLLFPRIMNMIPLSSLAAILLVTGYKLAKPTQFKSMYAQGWAVFTPFIVTVLGVVFIDLLKGVMIGMALGIFILLRNNFKIPFHFDAKRHVKGTPIRIELSEDVTFLNKASIMNTLAELPKGSHVILDASRTMALDPDVQEIIQDQMVRAKEQGITIECIGFQQRDLPRMEDLRASVSRAAKANS